MSWAVIAELLNGFGLPVVGLLALGWAWWRERSDNRDLNAEILENATEMAAALVGVKETTQGFKEVLQKVDQRLESLEKLLVELKATMPKR